MAEQDATIKLTVDDGNSSSTIGNLITQFDRLAESAAGSLEGVGPGVASMLAALGSAGSSLSLISSVFTSTATAVDATGAAFTSTGQAAAGLFGILSSGNVGDLGNEFTKVGSAVRDMSTAFVDGLAVVGLSLANFKKGIDDAGKTDETLNRIALAARNNLSEPFDKSRQAVKAWSEQLSSSTGIAQDTLLAGIQKMADSNIKLTTAMKLTDEAARYSIGTSTDFASIESDLRLAIAGKTQALVDEAVITDEMAAKGVKLSAVYKSMEDEAKGAVELYRNSLPGALQITSNNFDQMMKKFADDSGLVQALTKIVQWVNTLLPSIQKLGDEGIFFIKSAFEALKPTIDLVSEAFQKIEPIVARFVNTTARQLWAVIKDVVPSLVEFAKIVYNVAQQVLNDLTPAIEKLWKDFVSILPSMGDLTKSVTGFAGVLQDLEPILVWVAEYFIHQWEAAVLAYKLKLDEMTLATDLFGGIFLGKWGKFGQDWNKVVVDIWKGIDNKWFGGLDNMVAGTKATFDILIEVVKKSDQIINDSLNPSAAIRARALKEAQDFDNGPTFADYYKKEKAALAGWEDANGGSAGVGSQFDFAKYEKDLNAWLAKINNIKKSGKGKSDDDTIQNSEGTYNGPQAQTEKNIDIDALTAAWTSLAKAKNLVTLANKAYSTTVNATLDTTKLDERNQLNLVTAYERARTELANNIPAVAASSAAVRAQREAMEAAYVTLVKTSVNLNAVTKSQEGHTKQTREDSIALHGVTEAHRLANDAYDKSVAKLREATKSLDAHQALVEKDTTAVKEFTAAQQALATSIVDTNEKVLKSVRDNEATHALTASTGLAYYTQQYELAKKAEDDYERSHRDHGGKPLENAGLVNLENQAATQMGAARITYDNFFADLAKAWKLNNEKIATDNADFYNTLGMSTKQLYEYYNNEYQTDLNNYQAAVLAKSDYLDIYQAKVITSQSKMNEALKAIRQEDLDNERKVYQEKLTMIESLFDNINKRKTFKDILADLTAASEKRGVETLSKMIAGPEPGKDSTLKGPILPTINPQLTANNAALNTSHLDFNLAHTDASITHSAFSVAHTDSGNVHTALTNLTQTIKDWHVPSSSTSSGSNLTTTPTGSVSTSNISMPTAGHPYSFAQLQKLWVESGGDSKYAAQMAFVSLNESSGNSNAVGLNKGSAQKDVGLWQIGTGGGAGNRGSVSSLQDPLINVKEAISLFNASHKSANQDWIASRHNWEPQLAAYNRGEKTPFTEAGANKTATGFDALFQGNTQTRDLNVNQNAVAGNSLHLTTDSAGKAVAAISGYSGPDSSNESFGSWGDSLIKVIGRVSSGPSMPTPTMVNVPKPDFSSTNNTAGVNLNLPSSGGQSVGAQDTSNYIQGGLQLFQSLQQGHNGVGGGTFQQFLGGTGEIIGTAYGGPVGGMIGQAAGSLIGSLFGNKHLGPDHQPDIYNEIPTVTAEGELMGHGGATGLQGVQNFDPYLDPVMRQLSGPFGTNPASKTGVTELQFIQRYVSQNQGSKDPYTAGLVADLLHQFGDSATGANGLMQGGKDGNFQVIGGAASGTAVSIQNLAQQAISAISAAGNTTAIYSVKRANPNFENQNITQWGTADKYGNFTQNPALPGGGSSTGTGKVGDLPGTRQAQDTSSTQAKAAATAVSASTSPTGVSGSGTATGSIVSLSEDTIRKLTGSATGYGVSGTVSAGSAGRNPTGTIIGGLLGAAIPGVGGLIGGAIGSLFGHHHNHAPTVDYSSGAASGGLRNAIVNNFNITLPNAVLMGTTIAQVADTISKAIVKNGQTNYANTGYH